MQPTSLLKLVAQARPAPPNPKAAQAARAVLAVVDRHIIPSYRALGLAADAQEKAWTTFAANRAAGDVQTLRAAYNAV